MTNLETVEEMKKWDVTVRLSEFNQRWAISEKWSPITYNDVEATTLEAAVQKVKMIVTEKYSWVDIDSIEAKQSCNLSKIENVKGEDNMTNLETVEEMKKWEVEIRLAEFNYDHIEAYKKEAAIEEAEGIVAERYSWALIEKIDAKPIDEVEGEPELKVWQVDIQLGAFTYDHIEEETKEQAIQTAEGIIAEKYSWATIESIDAKQI